jgi:hypothetical protein
MHFSNVLQMNHPAPSSGHDSSDGSTHDNHHQDKVIIDSHAFTCENFQAHKNGNGNPKSRGPNV